MSWNHFPFRPKSFQRQLSTTTWLISALNNLLLPSISRNSTPISTYCWRYCSKITCIHKSDKKEELMDRVPKLGITELSLFPHIWTLIRQPLSKSSKIVSSRFFQKTQLRVKRWWKLKSSNLDRLIELKFPKTKAWTKF